MNERINELAVAAGGHEVAPYDFLFRQQDMQKFIELIVQECVDQIIEKGTDWIDWKPSQPGIRPEYVEMAEQIKRHFKIDS